jgi:hypothetical protein
MFNPLKLKLIQIVFKNSVHTTKKTQHFTITKINLLMLFKEMIPVYSENHMKPINTEWRVIDCWSRWDIQLPLGMKGLMFCLYSIKYVLLKDKCYYFQCLLILLYIKICICCTCGSNCNCFHIGWLVFKQTFFFFCCVQNESRMSK